MGGNVARPSAVASGHDRSALLAATVIAAALLLLLLLTVAPVSAAAARLPALATDVGHVLTILAYGFAALAAGFTGFLLSLIHI